ncbi:hypothetical protein BDN70DRAFT_881493 [Pholiota conissans]|uniref:Uncharacterized protein n=1 Tax=Pholiota conissans TaxID=109636 RepID=A0A9P5YY35_9AGAR|nr:hypothetical protein BDN70DRAFT_881493 [Pholiota conissans]
MLASTFFPTPVLYLSAVSATICLPIFALSIVNFGLLSIWLNAAVAVIIAVHHITLCAVTWASRKRVQRSKVIIDDEESSPFHETDIEPPAAYSITNIVALAFLVILNAIAFSIMVDITTRGAMKSTLPQERVGSHKWNIKVEIGQSSVLGAELLVLSALLTVCALGRNRLIEEAKARKEEMEYDFW